MQTTTNHSRVDIRLGQFQEELKRQIVGCQLSSPDRSDWYQRAFDLAEKVKCGVNINYRVNGDQGRLLEDAILDAAKDLDSKERLAILALPIAAFVNTCCVK